MMDSTNIVSTPGGEMVLPGFGTVRTILDEMVFLDNLREVTDLSKLRLDYNSIIFCRSGRILVEVGGNQQVRVKPGQLLLIPTGKLIQPLMVSTDIDASALLVSDKLLKSVLGSQINIWNRAMYMKEIYVVDHLDWLEGMGAYTRSIFKEDKPQILFREIVTSFFRTMLLMICEELLRYGEMDTSDDTSTIHDKELFNNFLQQLASQEQKRQHVSFYADRLCITAKYLSTVCKRVSGKSPMRWITDSVMEDCYKLLVETDMSVKEISNRLGFPNSSFFGQYFRAQAGITPIEYRTEHKRMA